MLPRIRVAVYWQPANVRFGTVKLLPGVTAVAGDEVTIAGEQLSFPPDDGMNACPWTAYDAAAEFGMNPETPMMPTVGAVAGTDSV